MIPAKKAAKKAAKHVHHGDHDPKDLLHAYEHLGRIEILHGSLDKQAVKDIATLTMLAEQQLAGKRMKDAADLLRAAEHLSFGALNSSKAEKRIDPQLEEAIDKEFHHKLEKAEEHWAEKSYHHPAIEEIYTSVTERAEKAFENGAYRRALEFARGAEALAHVNVPNAKELESRAEAKNLKS